MHSRHSRHIRHSTHAAAAAAAAAALDPQTHFVYTRVSQIEGGGVSAPAYLWLDWP
jgi:hypothetical protein